MTEIVKKYDENVNKIRVYLGFNEIYQFIGCQVETGLRIGYDYPMY